MITKFTHPNAEARWQPAPVPTGSDWESLREAASHCTACPLYKNAHHTVFGEGPRNARVMMVGEQPGDQEDVRGKPFVGPAGQLLDRALEAAGLERTALYLTNTVKHFKWEARGRLRLHQKPSSRDIAACRPWVEAELRLIEPLVLVCLGATAAQTLVAPEVRVLRDRGRILASEFCPRTIITVHPSALLRAPDEAAKKAGFDQMVRDLRLVHRALAEADGG